MRGKATIVLGGKTIRLREAARELEMDPSPLSKILSGQRRPDSIRLGTMQRLARHFKFRSVDTFIEAVKARRAEGDALLAHGPERGPAASSRRGSSLSC